MKTTVIITSFKEPKTIGKAVIAILPQLSKEDELIVVAPDNETLDVAKKASKKVKIVKDFGKGKPAAMNLVVKKARGEILVWTDGDISINDKSVRELIYHFKNDKIGAVSGRPISIDSKSNRFGFWGHVLADVAHEQRQENSIKNKFLFCSGYLFAIRKKLMPKLPEELLSEDGYISYLIYKKGYRIAYEPKAIAYITYPKNFKDWIKQKKRSVGGYNQIAKLLNVKIRSFNQESINFWRLFKYVKNLNNFVWLIELFIARLYLWSVIYWDINVKKKRREEIWERIESTK
ncbi:glycosyltransferase [Candidatus Pacearchaeota archaeon]|nr:glycosyltransferase [Candidatus Pacearchaeota archaeon]